MLKNFKGRFSHDRDAEGTEHETSINGGRFLEEARHSGTEEKPINRDQTRVFDQLRCAVQQRVNITDERGQNRANEKVPIKNTQQNQEQGSEVSIPEKERLADVLEVCERYTDCFSHRSIHSPQRTSMSREEIQKFPPSKWERRKSACRSSSI